jgi:hypothetical protein
MKYDFVKPCSPYAMARRPFFSRGRRPEEPPGRRAPEKRDTVPFPRKNIYDLSGSSIYLLTKRQLWYILFHEL